MEVGKMIFLSKWVIYRFHVNLPGCTSLCPEVWDHVEKVLSFQTIGRSQGMRTTYREGVSVVSGFFFLVYGPSIVLFRVECQPLSLKGWSGIVNKICCECLAESGHLVGGFKYFLVSPLLGEMIQFDSYFWDGWFNHPPYMLQEKKQHNSELIVLKKTRRYIGQKPPNPATITFF